MKQKRAQLGWLPECVEEFDFAGMSVVRSGWVWLPAEEVLPLAHHQLVCIAVLVQITSGWRCVAFVDVVTVRNTTWLLEEERKTSDSVCLASNRPLGPVTGGHRTVNCEDLRNVYTDTIH